MAPRDNHFGHLDACSCREVVFCHACCFEWYRDDYGLMCPYCENDITEIVNPENDPRRIDTVSNLASPELLPLPSAEDSGTDEAYIEEHLDLRDFHFRRSTRTGPANRHQAPYIDSVLQLVLDMAQRFSQLRQNEGMSLFPRSDYGSYAPRIQRHIFTSGPPGGETGYVTIFSGPVYGSHSASSIVGEDHPNRGSIDLFQALSNAIRDMLRPQGAGEVGPQLGYAGRLQETLNRVNPANATTRDAVYSQEALDRVITQLMEANWQSSAAPPASPAAINNLERRTVDRELLGPEGKVECSICTDEMKSHDMGRLRGQIEQPALRSPLWNVSIIRTSSQVLTPRASCLVDNVQLLRRSAEDAKRDARQWAASAGDTDFSVTHADDEGEGEGDEEAASVHESDSIGNTTRLIYVIRSALGSNQITAGSPELMATMKQLCHFQLSAQSSAGGLYATVIPEQGERQIGIHGGNLSGANIPPQDQVKAIKSQQICASRERERMIQGIQNMAVAHKTEQGMVMRNVLSGFGEEDIEMRGGADLEESTIALLIICRQLDVIQRGARGEVCQLCHFVGGEGGTGKSRVIETLVELFACKRISNSLLITATSGTAASRINGITIHSACGFSKDQAAGTSMAKDLDGVRLAKVTERFIHGQTRMDWQEKDLLVVDEVSMLGAQMLRAVNEQLRRLRGSHQDFGGIPIVLFCGDFQQFRPVHDRSILLPSVAISWDEDNSFKAEQRHQHDKAHALWKKFTTVVMLDEQVRAAGDLELQRLLKRIRLGVQDKTDLDLLNSRYYREAKRIPWETGITVVTPLNRNRWNLNMEAALSFQMQERSMRIFLSQHKWNNGRRTAEETTMMLNHGDESAIPVPGVFMFVPGMPVVVNRNTHQGLKLVNGASYTGLEVILDKAYPGHRISADTVIHFGPPAGIILESETTKDVHFVGMPPGTMLLTPVSVMIRRQRSRPWQQKDVSRKGLPCAAAFACTDYKVQSRTLERVALELRGTRTTTVDGRVVPSQCDPYSLYVQLSRCRSLDGMMLISKVRERDMVGNRVPQAMTTAQGRLDELSTRTIEEAQRWLGNDKA
ncbi:ATP-dependent DNA helicase PIF1 [Pochonia chlamydosporia 170]|uniref:ATP-dependent DNA helicase n=1 Tax=Pochonia chlamydosporia 170 TaxID=1380566 RepID=A0A179EZ90_METCM|nr:ATP-dependent DNA helicase PIF1 [Pochonia chlamydosporia 170]OAQ58219.2 ATP-dependent DNA helicase PIF1 [Pochonia chlamydosporia 170]